MPIDVDEFRQYLIIDKFALDDALKEQPSLLFQVSEAFESALARRDALKDQVSTVEAEVDVDIRESAAKTKEKVTEPQIKHLIATDHGREQAYKAYAEARALAGRLGALKEAFKERGYMLREMCSLYVSNYFEQASSRPTQNTDAAAYKQGRQRLAASRQR